MSIIARNIGSAILTAVLTQTDFLNLITPEATPHSIRTLAEECAEEVAYWFALYEMTTAPAAIVAEVVRRLETRAWDIIEAAEIEAAAEYERENAPGRYNGEYAFYASV